MFNLKVNDEDITNYISNMTWSGSDDTAARTLSFNVVFNHEAKDKAYGQKVPTISDTVQLIKDGETLFVGRVWLHSRDTSTNTHEYTAYDNTIYLARSVFHKKFKNITVEAVLSQVANELGYTVVLAPDVVLDRKVSFIADGMTGTEIFKKALDYQTDLSLHKYVIAGALGDKIIITSNNCAPIKDFSLSGHLNVINSTHSASLEELVDEVQIIDKDGQVISKVTDEDLIKKYGKIIKPYKLDEKQDAGMEALQMIKGEKYDSTVKALGYHKATAGQIVTVEEENLKGHFLILDDTHEITPTSYYMTLTLEFVKMDKQEKKGDAKAE